MFAANSEEEQQFKQQEALLRETERQFKEATTAEAFRDNLDSYIRTLVSGSAHHSTYFDSFVENKVLHTLMQRLQITKFDSAYFEAVFHNLEILIKSFKQEEETLYLANQLHKENFISEKYDFQREPQAEYYVLIVKSLLRTMLMHDERFVNIFVNVKYPHCPIAFNMMRFYNFGVEQISTASKYVLLELSTHPNAQSPFMKTYFTNFPFVGYYVHLCMFMRDTFQNALAKMLPSDVEHLVLQTVFLEEMVGNKGFETINIYSNTIFFVVVKHIYKLVVERKQPIGKVLRLFLSIVKNIKVEKVREGLRKVLRDQIEVRFEEYLLGKDVEVASYSYKFKSRGFLDDYITYVEEHCRCLYTGQLRKPRSVLSKALTSLNSYVSANQRWVEAEMQRLSEILGVQLLYCNIVDHDKQLPGSFLPHLDREFCAYKDNRLYKTVMEQSKNNEGVYHYYLLLLNELGMKGEPFASDLKTHVTMLQHCQSPSPLILALWIVSHHRFEFQGEQKETLKQAFRQTIDKILNYVLEEGWNSLIKVCLQLRGQARKLMLQDFQVGIFRDVDCEVLTLLTLRGFLGLKEQSRDIEALFKKEPLTRTTEMINAKICCSMSAESCTNHYLKVQSQYVRFYTGKDEPVGDYAIKRYKLYEDPTCPSILEFVSDSKETNESFTLYFADRKLAQYFQELFKTMRSRIAELELELHSLSFTVFA